MFVKMKDKKKIAMWLSITVSIYVMLWIAVVRHLETGKIFSSDITYKLMNLSIGRIFENQIMGMGISFLMFGLITVNLYSISKKVNLMKYVCILFVLSPPVIYSVINPNIELVFITIFISILNAIYFKKKIALAGLLTVSILFNSYHILFTAFGVLAAHIFLKDKYLKKIFLGFVAIAIIKGFYLNEIWLWGSGKFITQFTGFIQEFGAHYGISIIIVLMGVVGLILFWSKNSQIEIIAGIMATISIYAGNMILLNLIVIYFAAKIIQQFVESKWEVKAFEFAIIILTILLFVNSATILITETINEGPSKIEVTGYTNIADIEGIALYDVQKGNTLEYYTQLESFNEEKESIPDKISNQIYHSTKLDFTVELVKNNNINYIIINEDMRKEYWDGDEKGLLIMIQDEEYFKIIYEDEYMRVYKVLKSVHYG